MEQLDSQLDKPTDSLNVSETRRTAMPSSQPRRDRTVVFAGLVLLVLAGVAYVLLPNDLSALRESAQKLIDSLSRKEAAPAPASGSVPAAPVAASEPVFPPGSTQQQVMNPQAQASAEMAPAPLAAAPAAAGAAAAPPGNAQLRFVFSGESWVEVRDRDNKVIFSQRGAAGSEQSVSGQGPLTLVIGFAPGVKLFWHGQAIDLAPHTKGEVARLVLE
jgi:cytoskeleton protein RodZ